MNKRIVDNQLPDIIKENIIDEIMQGKLKSGDKLVEARYSEMFGTSRGPVREAFYLLNIEGYVEKIPRKGTIVKGFSSGEIMNILEIRNFLEQLSIIQMDAKSRGICVHEMRKIITEMERPNIEAKELAKLNYEFHFQLILASRSEVIQNTYSRMATQLISLQTISIIKKEITNNSLEEHKQIMHYLGNGDIDDASVLLKKHNEGVFPRIKESFQESHKGTDC